MKHLHYILVLIGVILIGCDSPTPQFHKEDGADSLVIRKDTNGNVTSVCNYKEGKAHGLCQFFYKNGQIEEEGYFYFNKPVGNFQCYDSNGVLKKIIEYQIVQGKSEINQFRIFDENGDIIKERSNYISLQMLQDTINQGEYSALKITLEAAYFKSRMEVEIGNFDDEYNLIDSVDYIKLPGNDFEVSYKFRAEKLGENIIRGFVKDYKNLDKPDTIRVRRDIYFTKKYFVKRG